MKMLSERLFHQSVQIVEHQCYEHDVEDVFYSKVEEHNGLLKKCPNARKMWRSGNGGKCLCRCLRCCLVEERNCFNSLFHVVNAQDVGTFHQGDGIKGRSSVESGVGIATNGFKNHRLS